ncbi:MAG: U32 family peptidase [Clostridiales bacterium]|jgi:putative protease|nr:U32 family peptidase [Clostridiales bacterium]
MKKPELLAPAGNLAKLKTAVQYGADAVYFGGEEFSLRTACDNFSPDDLKRGIDYVKSRGKKAYAATNIIMRDGDFDGLYRFARELHDLGADGVILADLGALDVVREAAPSLPIHISTQANTTNHRSAALLHRLGAKRVVLARELGEADVRELREKAPQSLELEMFVHGAMCVSYSGRCLLSGYMAGRDANRGECAHPCRWKYHLVEEKRPGEYIPVFENDSGSFFFNSKDLCLIEFLPQIIGAGVDALKIEGRVKSEYYAATVVKAYREELDRYLDNPETYVFDPARLDELRKVSHREYSYGFWQGRPNGGGQIYDRSAYIREYDVAGIVTECDADGNAVITQKNKFSAGDEVEVIRPKGGFLTMTLGKLYDADGAEIDSAPHAGMTVKTRLAEYAEPYAMLRKKRML